MYEAGNPVYKWHVEHFGHPSVFGYKDIIKRWNPSAFNAAQADKLVKLYKKAGATFFVAMGAHHDNFDMWDSNTSLDGTPRQRLEKISLEYGMMPPSAMG